MTSYEFSAFITVEAATQAEAEILAAGIETPERVSISLDDGEPYIEEDDE